MPPFVAKPEQTWLLYHKAKTVGQAPSYLLGLKRGSYEAYCIDEAVIYFGMSLDGMLEGAGQKPGKEERRAKAAREAILDLVFDNKKAGTGFADPAAMFQ